MLRSRLFAVLLFAALEVACSRTHDAPPDAAPADAFVARDAAIVDDATVDDAASIDAAEVDSAIVGRTCPTAFDLIDPMHLDADGVYRARVPSMGRLDEVSCARDGPSTERSGAMIHLSATVPGGWTLRSFDPSMTTEQLRTDCADTASEVECRATGGSPQRYPFVWPASGAGATIDWLLRSRDEVSAFDVEAWPPRLEGDTCAVAADDRSHVVVDCVSPLRCQSWADVPTCAINTPPTLERVEIYIERDGFHGHLIAWGTDATPTLRTIAGTGPGGAFDFYVVDPRFDGSEFVIEIRGALIRAGSYYDVQLGDGALRSNIVRVVPQPDGSGEPCERYPSLCPAGLSCEEAPDGVMRCQP